MGDISDINSAQSVKIVGSDATGVEQTPIASSTNGDLHTTDAPNQTGLNTTLNLTTSPVEGKVGGSALANRKYVIMQATTTGVKWGYDTNCLFTLFKDQLIIHPAGANCPIYFKAASGTATVLIGET